MIIPYVYILIWSKEKTKLPWDVKYLGSRYSKGCSKRSRVACHPNDLWNTYFTSSEYVKYFRLWHGEPDKKETFSCSSKEKVISLETRLLKKYKAAQSPNWLNRHNGGKNFHNDISFRKITNVFIWKCEGCGKEEERRDIVANHSHRFCSQSCVYKYSQKIGGKISKTFLHKCEWCKKEEEKLDTYDNRADRFCSQSCAITFRNTGRKHSEETKRKIGAANKGNQNCVGRLASKETKEKIRKARRKKSFKRFVGVRCRKKRSSTEIQKFETRICINGKVLCLGYFNTEIEAAIVYDIATIKHFGYPVNFLN